MLFEFLKKLVLYVSGSGGAMLGSNTLMDELLLCLFTRAKISDEVCLGRSSGMLS